MMDAVKVEPIGDFAADSGPDAEKPCADDAPRRGRPRSKQFDESILAATLELAGEVGIKGMSMDELAQRAGVSKATIYRRWPSKEILVLQALQSAMQPLDAADTDIELVLDALLGPLIYRRLLSGGVLDADFLDRLIVLVLPGR